MSKDKSSVLSRWESPDYTLDPTFFKGILEALQEIPEFNWSLPHKDSPALTLTESERELMRRVGMLWGHYMISDLRPADFRLSENAYRFVFERKSELEPLEHVYYAPSPFAAVWMAGAVYYCETEGRSYPTPYELGLENPQGRYHLNMPGNTSRKALKDLRQEIRESVLAAFDIPLDEIEEVRRKVYECRDGEFGGVYWVGWTIYQFFFLEVMHYKCKDFFALRATVEALMSSGPAYPTGFGRGAGKYPSLVISDRAVNHHFNADNPLGSGRPVDFSSTKGLALEFPDGWGHAFVRGVPLTEERFVTDLDSLTVEDVKKITNTEERRVAMECFGEERYLKESGAKLIDMDYEGTLTGAAPRAIFEDDAGDRFMLCTDGSTGRRYTLRVSREVSTCKEAHSQMAGFDESRILHKS